MTDKSKFNVYEIANLAKLELQAVLKDKLRRDMEEIVSYVEELSTLDLSNVPPMYHSSDVKNIFREDIAGESFPREQILSNAPELIEFELIKVPPVLPEEEE